MVKSKQSIKVVIGLMSIALAGVVIIQFLWLSSAIKLKQEEFNRSVNDALLRVATDLENKCGVNYLTEKLTEDSFARTALMKNDPGLYKFMVEVSNQPGQDEQEQEQAYVESHTAEDGETEDIHGPVYHYSNWISIHGASNNSRIITMVCQNGDQAERIIMRRTAVYNSPPAPPSPPPAPPVAPGDGEAPEYPGIKTKSKLFNIITNVADEYAMSKVPVEEMLDSEKIVSAIKKEFTAGQLPKDFEFAVYCADGDTLIINKGCSDNPLLDFKYKSPLLPSDFTEQRTMLLINIPSRIRFIFSSMAGMLMLSLFFTVVIIAAFAYALHIILRQKKLSEVTTDFINNMTHELKTPLATISLTADTLNLAAVSENAGMVTEYSGVIKHEVKKLSRHVDRILEAAVNERGNTDEQTGMVNLNDLIIAEARTFEPLVLQHNGRLQQLLPTEPVFVQANAENLQGVLCNLLDNALKYSKEMPQIKIELKKTGKSALLSVSDQGIGISKSDQKMVFEKFYRAHTGNRHDVKGFGLGLNFVQSVIEKLGGKVWVESELNTGSRFYIELPII